MVIRSDSTGWNSHFVGRSRVSVRPFCRSDGPQRSSPHTRVSHGRLEAPGGPTGWVIEPVPVPSVPDGEFSGISCVPLKVVWRLAGIRATWVKASPLPRNGTAPAGRSRRRPTARASGYAVLNSVSCYAAGECTAVGSYIKSGATQMLSLVASWDGTAWTVRAPEPLGSANTNLTGVSCLSAVACVAVGESGGVPIAEIWDGSSWKTQTLPPVENGDYADLRAVSCTSAQFCVGVGNSGDSPLVETWDGTRWTASTLTSPSGETVSGLNAVSCTATATCVAVGNEFGSSGRTPISELWNGTAWTSQSIPATDSASELDAVSCPTTMNCLAVGYSSRVPIAEVWGSGKWTLEPPLNPSETTASGLEGVSCATVTSCVAAGYSDGKSGTRLTLAEKWDGASWAVSVPPILLGRLTGQLAGVSCPTTDTCVAVGSVGTNGSANHGPLVETSTAGIWKIQTIPAPTNATYSQLSAVSCPSAGYCVAVGFYHQPIFPTEQPLVEVWHDTTWIVQQSAGLTFSTDANLSAISCSAPDQCTAVGFAGRNPLAESWNGTTWSAQTTATPQNVKWSQLLAVSCHSSQSCMAVGYSYNNNYLPLAEGWNGSSWTIVPAINPSGAAWAHLQGVSCPTDTACTAVGYFANPSGAFLPLVEAWDGAESSLQSTPHPAGDADSTLSGVSCISSTHCVGVGSSGGTGSNTSLVEVSNGTVWSTENAVNPQGTTGRPWIPCPARPYQSASPQAAMRRSAPRPHFPRQEADSAERGPL